MTPKVLIENNTAWPTKMLRPFIVRIAREEFSGTKPPNTRRSVKVIIGYNRGAGSAHCSGCAYYNSSTAYVHVPHPAYTSAFQLRKKGDPHVRFPVLDFCHVVGHEFGHCKGIHHKDMGLHYKRGAYSRAHYAWAQTLLVPVIRERVKPVKPTADELRAVRLKAAQAAVVRWTRKQKLATTKLRHWTRKVRALERAGEKMAACRNPVDETNPPAVSS